jgi:hypothetical protein
LSRARRRLLRAGLATLALAPVLLALAPAVEALALGRLPATAGSRQRETRACHQEPTDEQSASTMRFSR